MNLKITLVTPSYNQAEFLPECLQSVLSQNYPNLEYIVMDGGSTDDSAKIIRKHSKFLKAHRIQKDEGQYDAINSGFGLSHGGPNEIMGWLNSDGKHTPWTLRMVNEIFRQYPYVEWISSLYPLIWGSSGLPVRITDRAPFSAAEFYLGANVRKDYLQQESTFWRRSLWARSGAFLDTRWKLAADFELWARFFLGAHCYGVTTILGGFREHQAQKTATRMGEYNQEAQKILSEYQKKVSPLFLLRHRISKKIARFCGKRGYFQNKGWLSAASYLQHQSSRRWVMEGPRIYGSSMDRLQRTEKSKERTIQVEKREVGKRSIFCTYFDHNYLAQGLALLESLENHGGDFQLWVLAHSPECEVWLRKISHPCLKIVPISELLQLNPDLQRAKKTRSIAEFYFTASPTWLRHVLEQVRRGEAVTKIDADCFLFASPTSIQAGEKTASIVITPHRHTRETDIQFGIYNVGWVSIRNDKLGMSCVQRWEQQCLEWCFDKPDGKRYADQKYLDDWPSRYPGVHISNFSGANLAYWNVNQSQLSLDEEKVLADGKPLIFYHFSGLRKIQSRIYDPQWQEYGVRANDVLRNKIYRPYLQALRRQENRLGARLSNTSVRYEQNPRHVIGKLKIIRRVFYGRYLLAQ